MKKFVAIAEGAWTPDRKRRGKKLVNDSKRDSSASSISSHSVQGEGRKAVQHLPREKPSRKAGGNFGEEKRLF